PPCSRGPSGRRPWKSRRPWPPSAASNRRSRRTAARASTTATPCPRRSPVRSGRGRPRPSRLPRPAAGRPTRAGRPPRRRPAGS
ncbi:MAG: hypothetical protein EOO25_20240, partial [Comamonadaceae bacterium]